MRSVEAWDCVQLCEVGFRQKSGSGSPTMGDQIRSDSLAHIQLCSVGGY